MRLTSREILGTDGNCRGESDEDSGIANSGQRKAQRIVDNAQTKPNDGCKAASWKSCMSQQEAVQLYNLLQLYSCSTTGTAVMRSRILVHAATAVVCAQLAVWVPTAA